MDKELESEFDVTRFCDYVEAYFKRTEDLVKTSISTVLPVTSEDFNEIVMNMEAIRKDLDKRGLLIGINDGSESIKEYGHVYVFRISHKQS